MTTSPESTGPIIEASLPASEPETSAATSVSADPVPATLDQLRAVKADATISKHVALAAGTGFIPFPVFDVAATAGVQADLLWHLCKVYGQEISKEKARSVVTVLLGAAVPSLAARTVSSGLKLIPGVGTALSFFTSPSLAATSTYVVGKVVQDHLAGGGNILDLQLSKAKDKVAEEMSKLKSKSGSVVSGIKTKSGEVFSEGKQRVGNAVAALRGKNVTVPPAAEEHAAAAS
jgi:uncharacterized protein (DUF697 family)